jgi:hypothetical protein
MSQTPLFKVFENSLLRFDCEVVSRLSKLDHERDYLIGRLIAEELREANLSEFEKLGMALRWYRWKDKLTVRAGYRFQVNEMLKINHPCLMEAKNVG